MPGKIQNRIADLEAMIDVMKQSVMALKQELSDGGASGNSARKGALPKSEIQKVLAKRQKNRMRNNQ